MQMSESVALLRALRQLSKGLERAERIVGEVLSRGDKRRSKRPKHSNRLVLMKRR